MSAMPTIDPSFTNFVAADASENSFSRRDKAHIIGNGVHRNSAGPE
jgi:hypothetical protein